jgi:epimerase transport system membrane fusion protein
VQFPQEILEIKDKIEDIIDGQINVFLTRRNLRIDEKKIMQKRIEQLRRQIQGIGSVIESRKQHVESISEEIQEWERLVKEQLSDKIKLRDLKRQKINIEGEIASQKADMSRLEVQITETQTQQLLQEKSFKEEVLSQLQEVQQKLNDLRSRRLALMDQLDRTKITSPVDGTIVGLDVHTIGGVIAPGKPVMTIVPKQSDLIVEAKMQTTDIDNVHAGLLADVRFSAFKQQMVHVVEGEVLNVSADALVDEQSGNPYYRVDVRVTPKGFQQLAENNFFLLPGMPAEVLIKTGERTVLSYLLNPFTNMLSRAFKED